MLSSRDRHDQSHYFQGMSFIFRSFLKTLAGAQQAEFRTPLAQLVAGGCSLRSEVLHHKLFHSTSSWTLTQIGILLPGDKSVNNSSNKQYSAPVQPYLVPPCHPDHVTAERSELLPSPEPEPPDSTFHSRTLDLTGPALTAGRRSLGREGTRFPPGHLLARTPNQHASLHQPLVSGSHRQGSYLSRAKANERWGWDAPAQGLFCQWGA